LGDGGQTPVVVELVDLLPTPFSFVDSFGGLRINSGQGDVFWGRRQLSVFSK